MPELRTPDSHRDSTSPEPACAPARAAQASRKRYERPAIIDYGSVRDLTRGAGSKPTFDGMSGNRRT